MPDTTSVPVRQDSRPGPLLWPDLPFAMRCAAAGAAERTIQISAA